MPSYGSQAPSSSPAKISADSPDARPYILRNVVDWDAVKDSSRDELLDKVSRATFTVAVTGAGMSKASGLPLLSAEVCGIPLSEFFRGKLLYDNPSLFYEVYRTILQRWGNASPNAGHEALAQSSTLIVTQNIDGLHRLAGSQHLIELHGNFRELRCEGCGVIESSLRTLDCEIPKCPRCGEMLIPGIVFEGKEVRHAALAMDWMGRAQVLFIVGTKMEMNPVRRMAAAVGPETLVIRINKRAEWALPQLCRR